MTNKTLNGNGIKDHCEGTELESHQMAINIFLLPSDGLVRSYIHGSFMIIFTQNSTIFH